MNSIGPNTKGFALTTQGTRPVIVEYVDRAVGFFHVTDLETGKPYTVHYSNFNMLKQIPNRFREHHFKRVAHVWARALDQHPEPTTINPYPLELDSYVKLLRDAREGKNTYGWTDPTIDETRWRDIANDLSVTATSEGVVIGLRSAKKLKDQKPLGIVRDTTEVWVDWKSQNEIEALCLLLDHKAILPRPNFVITGLSDGQIESLESRYEVGFVQHETDKNKWSIV